MNSRRLVLLSLLAAAITPAVAAKLSKADVQYQDKPKAAGRDCDDCIQYVQTSLDGPCFDQALFCNDN